MPTGIQAAQLYVGVGALGARDTVAEILRLSATVDKVDGQSANVSVTAETGGAIRMVDELSAKAELLQDIDPSISVSAAGGPSVAILDDLKNKANYLDDIDPRITISADGRTAAMVIDQLQNEIKALQGQMATFGGITMGPGGGMGKLGIASQVAQMAMMARGGGGGLMAAGMTGMGGAQALAGMGIGGVAAGVGGVALAGAALSIGSIMKAAEFERYETQLGVLLGTAEKAKQRIAELADFGAKTPFELPEIVQASKMLQIFSGDVLSTGDGLRMIGDIAAGTQQPFNEVAMWFGRMYDAMKSGRPFGEATMRLQEMGALSGQSRQKIEDLAEEVKNGSMTMTEAWAAASGEFGRYSGMMDKQSMTFEGKMSNLADAVGMGLARLGEKMLPLAKGIIDIAIPAVELLAAGLGVLVDVVGLVLSPLGWLRDRIEDLFGWLDDNGVIKFFSDALAGIGDAAKTAADAITGAMRDVRAEQTRVEGVPVDIQPYIDSGAISGAMIPISDELRNANGQLADAASWGITEPIATAGEEGGEQAADGVDRGLVDIVSIIRQRRSEIIKAATSAGEALYRPMEARAELALTNLEIKRQQNLLNAKDATREERLQAELAMSAALRKKMELLTELASFGKLSKQKMTSFLDELKQKYKNSTGEARVEIGRLIAELERLMKKGQAAASSLNGINIGGRNSRSADSNYGPTAIGGRIDAGETRWVGEHGRELLTSDSGGFIWNDRDLTRAAMAAGAQQPSTSGGVNISVTVAPQFPSLVPYNPGDMEEIARKIGPSLVPYLLGRGFRTA